MFSKTSASEGIVKTGIRIAALIATHHLPEESLPWVSQARQIFGEVVIFLDESRLTPGTLARAKAVATRVQLWRAKSWYELDFGAMARSCESDWIFILDYDEQLSPEWHQDEWRQILATTEFSHFWIPRRWTVPHGRYISDNPWWPDFQLRLFQNRLEGTIFPTKLHDPIRIPGPCAAFRNLTIYHHVLALCSRAEREEKVRLYGKLRPGRESGHYYLYENYRPAETSLCQLTRLDSDHEVIRMEALTDADIAGLSIKLTGAIEEITVSEMFWLGVEVTNATDRPLYSCAPFPVRLSYHWIQPATRRTIVFEGERSGVFPCAPANAITRWKMVVLAPSEPGEYILQMTAVQDGIRWFEHVNPSILQEFVMMVTEKKK